MELAIWSGLGDRCGLAGIGTQRRSVLFVLESGTCQAVMIGSSLRLSVSCVYLHHGLSRYGTFRATWSPGQHSINNEAPACVYKLDEYPVAVEDLRLHLRFHLAIHRITPRHYSPSSPDSRKCHGNWMPQTRPVSSCLLIHSPSLGPVLSDDSDMK